MATAKGPIDYEYKTDSGLSMFYPMHKYLGDAQNANPMNTTGGNTAGKWPYKRSWLRHIGVLFTDGTRDEIPIMSNANSLYLAGGTISIAFPSGTKTGVITGRRGEKLHLAHS